MRDRYHRSLVDRMRLAGLHGKPSDVASVWADTRLRRRLSVDLTFYVLAWRNLQESSQCLQTSRVLREPEGTPSHC
jgi:hypothetical protein